MDELTFMKGWTVLTSMSYANFLAYDETKYEMQLMMFKKATAQYDGASWLRVVEHWILKETDWPKLPEILAMLKSKLPVKHYQLTAPPAPVGYLPRRIYQRDEPRLKDKTIFEAALILIPEWLKTAEKGDPDYQRAENFLRRAKEECQRKAHFRVGALPTGDPVSVYAENNLDGKAFV